MKRKDLLLLTLLLTQTAPLYAGGPGTDDDNISKKSTARPKSPSTETSDVQKPNNKPGVQRSEVLKKAEHFQAEARKATEVKTSTPVPHNNSPVKVSDQAPETQGNLEKLRAAIQNAQTATQERLARFKNIADKDNTVFVVGFSGNGKTTLIEGLAGSLYAHDEDGTLKLASRNPLKDFRIGEGNGTAGTTIPGGWYDKQKSHGMMFWDWPGFGDPGKNGEDIINEAARRELFTPNTRARVLLVVEEGVLFEAQPKEFQRLLNELTGVFTNTSQLKDRLSVVVTKKSNKNPKTRLKTLKDKGTLQLLTPSARDLFEFMVDNMDTRLAYLPEPSQEGDYTFDKQAIFKVIENSVPTLIPVVGPYLNDPSKLLTLDLAKNLNKEATDFIKTKGAASVISYCNNEIAKDKNSIATLKWTLPQVVKDLRKVQNANTPEDVLTLLDKFIPKENPVRKTVEMLDFLKGLNKDVTSNLSTWSKDLSNKITEVNKILLDFVAHHNKVVTDFLKKEGTQRIVNYCKNEINNHQGSVTELRTKLKVVLKDLQDLQDPNQPITSDGFSKKITKYLSSSTVKDTVDAIDYLKKENINGTAVCDVASWSDALKDITAKIKKLTDKPEIKFDSISNVLSVKGIIVGTSDLSSELRAHANPVKIEVLALNTLFIDQNIEGRGTCGNFIAPQWYIHGTQSVTFTGKDSEKARNGLTAGSDGSPGAPGGNGGHFYGKGLSFTNLNNLTITVNGGRGGAGGDGHKGATGSAATDGSGATLAEQSRVVHIEKMAHPIYDKDGEHEIKGYRITSGSGGGKGGTGGTGGLGGAGGKGGLAGVALIDGTAQSHTVVKTQGNHGTKGNNGAGGEGGKGGDLWHAIRITELTGSYERHWTDGFITQHHYVTEPLSRPARWEMAPRKIGEGEKGDTGTQPASTLVSSVVPNDPAKLVYVDSNGNLTTDYKNACFKEYKEFQKLQSIDPVVSPFIKLFPSK